MAVRVQLYLGAQATTEALDAGKQRESREIRRKQWAQPSSAPYTGDRQLVITVGPGRRSKFLLQMKIMPSAISGS